MIRRSLPYSSSSSAGMHAAVHLVGEQAVDAGLEEARQQRPHVTVAVRVPDSMPGGVQLLADALVARARPRCVKKSSETIGPFLKQMSSHPEAKSKSTCGSTWSREVLDQQAGRSPPCPRPCRGSRSRRRPAPRTSACRGSGRSSSRSRRPAGSRGRRGWCRLHGARCRPCAPGSSRRKRSSLQRFQSSGVTIEALM